MRAGHAHREVAERLAATERLEVRVEPGELDVLRAVVGLPRDAVGHVAARDLREDRLHVRVVEAEHREPVERDLVGELHEGFLHLLVRAVVIEVLGVDVGDDGDGRA